MSILDNEGHSPAAPGNLPSRAELNDMREENIKLLAALEQAERSRDGWIDVNAAAGLALGTANDTIGRLRDALHKIASAYPCSTAKDMSRVAAEALGIQT